MEFPFAGAAVSSSMAVTSRRLGGIKSGSVVNGIDGDGDGICVGGKADVPPFVVVSTLEPAEPEV